MLKLNDHVKYTYPYSQRQGQVCTIIEISRYMDDVKVLFKDGKTIRTYKQFLKPMSISRDKLGKQYV